jgi:Holliday junction resolvase RusA-like endonuclease
MEISFVVYGTPKGQPRPRAFARNGLVRMYDPGTAEAWKGEIALAAKPHTPSEPIAGPVALNLQFYFARPKKHYKRETLRADAPYRHTGKPDIDNLCKAVMDALTQLRWWHDDAQVASLVGLKIYTEAGFEGVLVKVFAIAESEVCGE